MSAKRTLEYLEALRKEVNVLVNLNKFFESQVEEEKRRYDTMKNEKEKLISIQSDHIRTLQNELRKAKAAVRDLPFDSTSYKEINNDRPGTTVRIAIETDQRPEIRVIGNRNAYDLEEEEPPQKTRRQKRFK